jgi:hypothetical protein
VHIVLIINKQRPNTKNDKPEKNYQSRKCGKRIKSLKKLFTIKKNNTHFLKR